MATQIDPSLENNEFKIKAEVFEDADIIVGFFSEIDDDEMVIRPEDEGVISSLTIYDVLTKRTSHAGVNAEHVRERLEQLDKERDAKGMRRLTVAQVNAILAHVNNLVENILPKVVVVRAGVTVIQLT